MRTQLENAARQFESYPTYKDSGVEWLSEIPAHWEVKRLRHLVRRIEQGWSPVAEDRHAALDEWGVIKLSAVSKGKFLGHEHKALPADLAPDTRYEIHEGDFLLTRANTPDLVGDVCVAHGVRGGLMLCDLVYRLQLFDEEVVSTYLAYWLLSRAGRHQVEIDARGSSQSMVKVSQGLIRAWAVVVPPLEEQRAIAGFLTRETARIDVLVAKKEQLIELLQEKRTALITRAVTQGLDPNVPMKNSGVAWLGEIPAHWEVKRTKFAAVLRSGHTPSRQHPEYWEDCTIPWFGLADVWQIRDGDREYVTETAEKISELGLANSAARLLPKGTVMLSRTASVGFSAIMDVDMATTQDFVNWVCGPTLRPEYLLYVLRSMQHEFRRLTMGSTHQTIYMPDVGQFSTPLPPIPEQDRLVAFVRERTRQIDRLVAKVRDAIDRLKELRTALISAAVTGKIDVREEFA